MGSTLVDAVRTVIADAGRPLTARERALLTATVVRHDGREADVVELLDVARRAMRYRLHATGTRPAPELVALLAAVDAILDPPTEGPTHGGDRVLVGAGAPFRRDVDG